MKLHPIQLIFTHQSSIVARHRFPDTEKPHEDKPSEPVLAEDMDQLVARIIKFIDALGVEPDMEPMGLALLIGKGLANKNNQQDNVCDLTIPLKNLCGVSHVEQEPDVKRKGLTIPSDRGLGPIDLPDPTVRLIPGDLGPIDLSDLIVHKGPRDPDLPDPREPVGQPLDLPLPPSAR